MEQKNKINPAIVIAVLLQAIFVIFAIITINNILNQKDNVPKITIDNFFDTSKEKLTGNIDYEETDSNLELDSEKKSLIEAVLYNIVSLNNIGDIMNYDAKFRKDSVYNIYIDDLDMYLLNAIVDVESLGQSYHIVYRWSDNNPNTNIPINNPVMAFCLPEDKLIYDNFTCKDDYTDNGDNIVVYELLRYKLFRYSSVGVSGDVYAGSPLLIMINTLSNDEPSKTAAISEVSNYLSSAGFNLDDFNYTVGVIESAN